MKKKFDSPSSFVLLGVCILCVMLIIAIVLSACNGQYMAKNWGTTCTIDLEPGYHLVEITWNRRASDESSY